MVNTQTETGFRWAVPEELGIPPDTLRLRLDFFHQAIEMTFYDEEKIYCRTVSAMDIAHVLARELTFGTGILPPNTLWWRSTKTGSITAIYVEPHLRQVALQVNTNNPPERYKIPLPGLIFLCKSGAAPWVFAVKRKPRKETDQVYRAPLANVFNNGLSCPGTNKYPTKVEDTIESFFISFFTPTADLLNRSRRFPQNILKLWKELDGKKEYPMDDLIEHGTIKDLLRMEMEW